MKTFKSFLEESRRTSAEAGVQNASKSLGVLKDKMLKGVTSHDLEKQSDEHDKKYSEHMKQIRSKIDANRSWIGSSEHKSLLRKANTHMTKSQNLKNDASIARQHEEKNYK